MRYTQKLNTELFSLFQTNLAVEKWYKDKNQE